jgi:hypothetical protein
MKKLYIGYFLGGVNPFTPQGKLLLARVLTRRVYAIILLLVNPYEAIFP